MTSSRAPAALKATMPHELFGVQSLRGLAALLVVLVHSTSFHQFSLVPRWFSFGEAGVDLFFVISGFIMMYITPRAFRGWRDQAAFLVRRFCRIYLVYWSIALPLILLWLVNPGHVYAHHEHHDLVSSLLLTPSRRVPIVSVAWTLIFELYFYIVSSFIFYFERGRRIALILAWFGLVAAANILHPQAFGNPWLHVWFSPLTFEFILGMVLAVILQFESIRLPEWLAWSGLAAASLYGISAGINHGTFNVFAPDLVRVLCYGLPAFVILGILLQMEIQKTWRGTAKFVWIGDRSFSIYLLHLPILATFLSVASRWISFTNRFENLLAFLVFVVLAIVPIELFYRLIERPSHTLARRVGGLVRPPATLSV